MTFLLAGYPIYEFDVAITDFFLCLEALLFTYIFYTKTTKHTLLSRLFTALFFSISVSSFIGSLFHAFYPLKADTRGGFLVWILIGAAIGSTACVVWCINWFFYKNSIHLSKPLHYLSLSFAVYLLVLLFINHDFIVIICYYLPAMVSLAYIALRKFLQTQSMAMFSVFLGTVLTFVAAAVQVFHVSIHPEYFNFNALYHTIQGLALLVLFFSFRAVLKRKLH